VHAKKALFLGYQPAAWVAFPARARLCFLLCIAHFASIPVHSWLQKSYETVRLGGGYENRTLFINGLQQPKPYAYGFHGMPDTTLCYLCFLTVRFLSVSICGLRVLFSPCASVSPWLAWLFGSLELLLRAGRFMSLLGNRR
jgi:hypothetical protein